MSPNDRTPLLDGNGQTEQRPFVHRVLDFVKGSEDQPSWLSSFRYLLFGSWVNVLLVFVPLAFVADKLEWDAGLRFGFSFVAIVPLAALLGNATEQLSVKLGQTLGGLLNASFGNAVEIIVGIAALMRGERTLSVSSRGVLTDACLQMKSGLSKPRLVARNIRYFTRMLMNIVDAWIHSFQYPPRFGHVILRRWPQVQRKQFPGHCRPGVSSISCFILRSKLTKPAIQFCFCRFRLKC
jgi:hypothetical protein